MLKEIANPKAGQLKVHEPRLASEVFVDNLVNSNSPLFNGIRQQLVLNRLPNLAQRLVAMAAKSGKEVLS